MTQYPYPMSAEADTRIYKPQHPQRFANVDVDDSAAPLTFSDTSSRQGPYDASSPQVSTDAVCLHFNGHFPGEPGYPVFIESKDDGGGEW